MSKQGSGQSRMVASNCKKKCKIFTQHPNPENKDLGVFDKTT